MRRPGQAQSILLGPGVRALVGAHPPRPVVLDAHAAEEAPTRARPSVRARVVLRVRPQRGLGVADERSVGLPGLEQLARGRVRIRVVGSGLGEVDRHHVERRAR